MKKIHLLVYGILLSVVLLVSCGSDDAPQWPIVIEPDEFFVNEETGIYRIQVLTVEQEQVTSSYLRKNIEAEIVSVPDDTYQKNTVLSKGLIVLIHYPEVLPASVAPGDEFNVYITHYSIPFLYKESESRRTIAIQLDN